MDEVHEKKDILQRGFLDLNRPEYPRNPELLLSALAWKHLAVLPAKEDGKLLGHVYEFLSAAEEGRKHRTIQIQATRPANLAAFASDLSTAGISLADGRPMDGLARCVLDGLRGVVARKSRAYSAVPVVPEAALLQDAIGMHSKSGPPDFGTIIEQLYRLGGDSSCSPTAASDAWYRTLSMDSSNLFFRDMGKALENSLPESMRPSLGNSHGVNPAPTESGMPGWLKGYPTPFRWFRRRWDCYCDNDWRGQLPRRRWTDWGACILRTAVGLGYLWEARFYSRLGREAMGMTPDLSQAAQGVLSASEPLLAWKQMDEPVSSRDVASPMKRMVGDGWMVRDLILRLLHDQPEVLDLRVMVRSQSRENGLQDIIAELRKAITMGTLPRKQLLDCYGKRLSSSAENTSETVRYLLLCRKPTGEDADYYSLLTARGTRYRVVEPGPEWVVVVASLVSGRPGVATTLGVLRRDLFDLGLRPSREVLVEELERAGLSKSSHDADDGIEVSCGF